MPHRLAIMLPVCLGLAACATATETPVAAPATVASLPAPAEANAQAKLLDLGRCNAETQDRVTAAPDDKQFKAAVDRCMRDRGYRRDDIAEQPGTAKPRRAS